MLKRFFFFTFVTVALLGCSTMHSSQYSSPLEVKLVAPLKADVEVAGTISGEASLVNLLMFFNIGQPNEIAEGISYGADTSRTTFLNLIPYEDLKAAAAYNAVSKSNSRSYIVVVADIRLKLVAKACHQRELWCELKVVLFEERHLPLVEFQVRVAAPDAKIDWPVLLIRFQTRKRKGAGEVVFGDRTVCLIHAAQARLQRQLFTKPRVQIAELISAAGIFNVVLSAAG